MKILVTGGEGQLGTALNCCPTNHQIIALGRTEFNLSNPDIMEDLLQAIQPDIIINAAAWTDVDAAEDHPKSANAINATGAGNLANLCAKSNIRLIHISTDYVFDGRKFGPWCENDHPAPQTIYGSSKLLGEQAVAEANPRHTIVRTSWVYSAHGKNFVKTMLRLAKQNNPISVVDDQIGCPTYAPHLAKTLLDLSEKLNEGLSCKLLHLTGSGQTSWAGFAKQIFAESQKLGGPSAHVKPIASSAFPTKAKRPANSVLDCNLASSKLALALPDWKVGVSACLKELQRQS